MSRAIYTTEAIYARFAELVKGVLLLPLLPPDYKPRVLIAGGDPAAAQQTSEMIDLSDAVPAWKALPNLNQPRMHQVNSVLMPDSRVFLAGGIPNTGGPAEILDTKNLAAGWVPCAVMKYSRGYHSTAILLADGSILMGGDQDITGGWKSGETTPHERSAKNAIVRLSGDQKG